MKPVLAVCFSLINPTQRRIRGLGLAAALSVLLSACGGGGGGGATATTDTGNNTITPSTVKVDTSKYVGSWASCGLAGGKVTIRLAQASNNSLDMTMVGQFYSNNDCTGTLLATVNYGFVINQAFETQAQTTALLPPRTTAASYTIDAGTAKLTQNQQATVTGSATKTFKQGTWQYCIARGTGQQCFLEPVAADGSTAFDNLGLYLDTNRIFIFSKSGSTYTTDGFAYERVTP